MGTDAQGGRQRTGGVAIQVGLDAKPCDLHSYGGAGTLETLFCQPEADGTHRQMAIAVKQILLVRRPEALPRTSHAEF